MTENNTMIFTLTFNTDGGSGEFYDVTGEASSYYQLPSTYPFRPGYGFMGWRNCANEIFQPGGDYYFNYGDDTLTAVWEPIELTLTFDTNGSPDVIPSVTGLETESILLGNVPIREGYYFSRWVNSTGDSFCIGDTYTFNYGNDTLTAVWGSTVTFDLNGGEGYFPDVSGEVMTNTLIPEEIPTKAGYNFVKWSSTKYGDMNPGDPYFFTGNDTLTAVWETAWYTLTYDLNQADAPESIESQEGQATTNILLSETVPTREGYTFIRWENTEGEKFLPGDPYFFGYHDDTITAVWGYTVTINFGDGRIETVKGGVGEALDFIPTSEYGTFYSWINKNSQEFLPGEYTFVHGDDYLTARWCYTVSYDTNGGIGEFASQTTILGETIIIPSELPTKEDHAFNGWISTAGDSFYPGETYDKNEPTTLTASWVCHLYFDTNGGDEDSYLISALPEGEVFDLPAPTRANYTFIKWVNSDGIEFCPDDEYKLIYGHDTLTAVWEGTIAFDTNGGDDAIEPITAFHGEMITLPVPYREGYDFICWRNGMETTYTDAFHMLYGNDTLIAVWELKTYNVSYDVEGFADQTKEYFTNVTLHTSVPTMEGYTFLNWEGDNGSYYDAGEEYTVNGNLALTAVWVENGKTVITYDLSGGTGEFPKQTKGEGESITLHSGKPTAEGVGFYRWVDQNGNTYEEGAAYSGSESLKLSVYWKPEYTITYLDGKGRVGKTQAKLEGETINLLDYIPTKEGYEFVYWLIKGADGMYEPEDEFSIDCNVTLKPVWRRIYTVAYSDDYSAFDYDEKASGESLIVRENTLTKEGYTFVCWQWDNRNEYYFPGDTFTKDEDGAFRPVWVETAKKKIVYDIGDAEGDFSAQEADKDQDIVLSSEIPVKDGCVFNGWIVMPCAEEDSIEPMQAYSLASVSNVADSTNTIIDGRYVGRSSAVLKADMRGTYTVSFCDKYGAVIHTQQKNYGEDITLWSTTPTMSSYEFVCWIDEESGEMYMPGDQFFKNRNTTLISKWTYATDFVGIEIFNKPDDMTVYIGVPHRLNAVANPMNLVVSSTWSSSNEAVATVDEKGVVTPLSLGTTTITVTATHNANGASETFEDHVNLTVVKHVFEFADGVSIDDADVREKALCMMDEYYKNKEIADVVDGRESKCDTCIFAFEGLGSGKQGSSATTDPNYHENGGYLKAMMIVTKGKIIEYVTRNASTLPDNRPDKLSPKQYMKKYGTSYLASTTLDAGIYDYETGYHKSSYLALLPSKWNEKSTEWKGWYLNSDDNDFHSGDCSGVNIHASGINPKESKLEANSLGCQLVYGGDYYDFGKKVGFLNERLTGISPTTSISTTLSSIIGVDSGYRVDVRVKYILNRDYDEKNKHYEKESNHDCNNGVFYPISHHTCITQGDYKCTEC